MKLFCKVMCCLTIFVCLDASAKGQEITIDRFLGVSESFLDHPIDCLSDADSMKVAEREIKKKFPVADDEMILSDKSCGKLGYHVKDETVTVELNPKDKTTIILDFRMWGDPALMKSCFNRFLKTVDKRKLTTASAVLKEYKKRFGSRFKDPSKGPARWINCDAEDIIDTVPLVIHETVHSLRKYAADEKSVGFFVAGTGYVEMPVDYTIYFGSSKPVTKVFNFNGPHEKKIAGLYAGIDVITLIDEVNAYASDGEIILSLVKNGYGNEFNRKDPSPDARTMLILPLILALTKADFDALKRVHPEVWNNFCGDEKRAEAINTIWARGVSISNALYAYLLDNKLIISKIEKKYFDYVKNKAPENLIPQG